MNKRIGLFTPVARKKKNAPTTTTSYVEITTAKDLVTKLVALGAKRVGLLRRDRLGTTQMEGTMFPVSDLKDEHVDWAAAKTKEFETRGLFYDEKPVA